MKTILIDTENISNKEYEYIANLKNYKLVFFETHNTMSKQISLSLAVKLSEARVKFKFIHVDVKGKNALDFKICMQAGKINNWHNVVYILSKDKGYDNLKEFNIHRIESVTNLTSQSYSTIRLFINNMKSLFKKKDCKEPTDTIESKVKSFISEICSKYKTDENFINKLIFAVNKKDKMLINITIQKKFKNSDIISQKQLYKALKGMIS